MKDWYEQLSKKVKEEIEKGIKDGINNEFLDHDIVMGRFSKWHKDRPKLDVN